MVETKQSGKLAVILHADVAGSTKLVQLDERLAHDRIRETFSRFSETIKQYHGRVQEIRGDALLAEFERASDAVTAALVFQSTQDAYLSQFSDSILPTIRIGIALGEVVIADSTVTGAGVVLAQRIEQLADSGEVCITAALHEALPRRMPFDRVNLGEQKLKGFDEPVRVYRVELISGESIPPPQKIVQRKSAQKPNKLIAVVVTVAVFLVGGSLLWLQPWNQGATIPVGDIYHNIPDKPSIAVLPFDNLSGDPEQEYFCDGISEDIAQYVLEGSVRKAGSRLRINAQLIDAVSGHQLWAERYDRELTNVFALQDEITGEIVSALSIQLSDQEKQQLGHSNTDSFAAYDVFLKGLTLATRNTKNGLSEGVELFREAIRLDPDFARAYGALAVALTRQVQFGFSDHPAETRDRALNLARKAESIDATSPQVLWSLGFVLNSHRQFADAIAALERAVTLSPSYADAFAMLALIHNNMGQPEKAIAFTNKAMDLNPRYTYRYPFLLGLANYTLGNYELAVQHLEEVMVRDDSASQARIFLIASYVRLNRLDDARWEVEKLTISYPEYTLSHIREFFPFAHQNTRDQLFMDLKMAGLPD
ncbi:MAG: tetratricopeptide repeat protein [Gammaproteobacteria bacterium]